MRQYDTQKKKWWAVAQTSEEETGLPQGRTGHVCAHKDAWHNAEVLVVWGGEGYGYEQVSGAYVDDGPWLFTFSTAAASEKQPSGAWRRLVPAGGVPQPKPWGAVGAMEQDALVLYGGLPTHDPLRIPKGGSLQQQATSAVWRLQWQPLGTLTSAEPTTGRCEGGAIVTLKGTALTDGTLGDVAAVWLGGVRAHAISVESDGSEVVARTGKSCGIAPRPARVESRAFGIMEANSAFTAADIRVSPRTLVLSPWSPWAELKLTPTAAPTAEITLTSLSTKPWRVGVAARSVEMSGGTPLVATTLGVARVPAYRWHASSCIAESPQVFHADPMEPWKTAAPNWWTARNYSSHTAQFLFTPRKSPFTGGRSMTCRSSGCRCSPRTTAS